MLTILVISFEIKPFIKNLNFISQVEVTNALENEFVYRYFGRMPAANGYLVIMNNLISVESAAE